MYGIGHNLNDVPLQGPATLPLDILCGNEPAKPDYRALYRQVFANSSDGIAIIGLDGRYLQQNPAHRNLLGYSDADLAERTPAIHLGEQAFATIAAALAQQGAWRGEVVSRKRNGENVPIELSAFTVKDDSGRPVCYVGIKRDISLRKWTEQALRGSETRFRTMFEQSPLSKQIFAPDGRCIQANAAWDKLFAADRLQLANYNVLQDEQFRDAGVMPLLQRAFAGEAVSLPPVYYDPARGGRAGRPRWVAATVYAVKDEAGNVREVVVVLDDITEQKQAEEQLRCAKEAAEAASKAKDRFLAVLSHELRTPLTPVTMVLANLETHPAMPEEARRDLSMVRRNIELETRLIDDLLDLSAILHGKLTMQLEPVGAHGLLAAVLEMCQGRILSAQVEVTCELGAAEDRVLADPARLQQVFWNLLSNAIKFTPVGGRIWVRTSQGPQGGLRIEFRDSGIGIEPEVLPRLFNAFEQGEQTVTRRYGGLGLGLSIARAIVQLLGGTLGVHSDGKGKGATFTVELPAAGEGSGQLRVAGCELRDSQLATHNSQLLSPPRILLVEDHPDTAATLRRLLEWAGYQVRVAHSVAEAIEALETEPFDLLISDLGLPDASGVDLMRRLRQRWPDRAIHGIAVSGFGMDGDRKATRAAGFAEHLTKPITVKQLQAAIGRVLGGSVA